MLTVYKKVDKSLENPSGIIEINVNDIEKPFLLCISAQSNHDKSIYGIIRQGAQAARVYTTQENAARFKTYDFPIDFLGVRFKKDKLYENSSSEIVESFLYPFLIGNGESFECILKQARKVNFMTYCDGTLTYEDIEKQLEDKLTRLNFHPDTIENILSQISLTAIGTLVDTSHFKATSTTFVDVNDLEISNGRTIGYQKILQTKQQKSIYGTIGRENNILYIYEGSGNHELKEYFKDDKIVKPAISSVISFHLENSIKNEKSDTLIPISSSGILQQLHTYADENKTSHLLLEKLDNKLQYDNSSKYTIEEANMKRELDLSYRELKKTKSQLERIETTKKTKEKQLDSIIDKMKEYSSDVTFHQILVAAGIWQAPVDRDIFHEPNDKQIRNAFYSLINSEKKDEISKYSQGPKL